MADVDYIGWANGLDPISKMKAANAFQNDVYSKFAANLAGRQTASGDYTDASATLGAVGDDANAQLLQQAGARQTMLGAESQGDVAGARAAAAQTGDQATYNSGQEGATQAAMQRYGALNWAADYLSQIKPQPGQSPADLQAARAQAFQGLANTGMLQNMGVSPQTIQKIGSGPLDDNTIAAYRARIPYNGMLKGDGGVETVYAGGNPIAQGYVSPTKLDSGPGTAQSLVDTRTGAPIASTAPQPYPLHVDSNALTGGVNVTNVNPGQPQAASPSPASAGMVQPGGSPGAVPTGHGAANNPYNLKSPLTGGTWNGQTGAEPNGIADFSDPAMADRAEGMVLNHYAQLGINTPQAFVARYASSSPPNQQAAYAAAIQQALGPQFDLRNPQTQATLKAVIARQEGNGASGGPVVAAGAPQGGVPGPGQSVQQGGVQGGLWQPSQVNGVSGLKNVVTGDFKPTAGTITPADAIRLTSERQQQLRSNPQVQDAQNAMTALQAMRGLARQNPSGMQAYSFLDTFARAINPGAVARSGTIEAIKEAQGIPDELKGKLLSLQGRGFLDGNTVQGLLDSVTPFVQGHYDQAAKLNQANAAWAQANGLDPKQVQVDIGSRPGRYVLGAVPPAARRQVGTTYQTPKGDYQWTGAGWRPAT